VRHQVCVSAVSSVVSLDFPGFCIYNNPMKITFDPKKREAALSERGLDFADAARVFAGVTLEVEDTRRDYGEPQIICYGLLSGRMVVVGDTPRGADRHVFSMRKANERERAKIAPRLAV
jgi:uncharacterized DUF497 family protein